jgi:death on curing protein
MSYDEPIPPFATRYQGRLESCLLAPFQTFDQKPLYLRLVRKAAVLFYGVIKDHPFMNGNKRMAVTLTLIFFYFNDKWVETSPDDLYKMACAVATSNPQNRDMVIDLLVRYFNVSLVDFPSQQTD